MEGGDVRGIGQPGAFAFDIARIDGVGADGFFAKKAREKRRVRGYARNLDARNRAPQARERSVPGSGMGDNFRKHGIVILRDLPPSAKPVSMRKPCPSRGMRQ